MNSLPGYHKDKVRRGSESTPRIDIFLTSLARRVLPRKARIIFLRLCYLLFDIIEVALGLRDKNVPWRSKTLAIGRGDFKEIGQKFLNYFIELGDLRPHHKVLDVGCGLGRMAIPLTTYLDEGGLYEGFDIDKAAIDWCENSISFRHSNFHFRWVDIFNNEYNPKGKFKASEYKFPYEDQFFDFIFLTSVFTHMLPEGLENYLFEIARVLKKGKKCLITYFLLNEESRKLIQSGKSQVDFKYDHGKFWTIDRNLLELAIAYEEVFVFSLYEKYGLKIEGVYYGSWCGRKEFLNYQDIIIASKNTS